jgi:hypothetical protein
MMKTKNVEKEMERISSVCDEEKSEMRVSV